MGDDGPANDDETIEEFINIGRGADNASSEDDSGGGGGGSKKKKKRKRKKDNMESFSGFGSDDGPSDEGLANDDETIEEFVNFGRGADNASREDDSGGGGGSSKKKKKKKRKRGRVETSAAGSDVSADDGPANDDETIEEFVNF